MMQKKWLGILGTALAVLVFGAVDARAAYQYVWTATPDVLNSADGTQQISVLDQGVVTWGHDGATYTNVQAATLQAFAPEGTESSFNDVVSLDVTVFSGLGGSANLHFEAHVFGTLSDKVSQIEVDLLGDLEQEVTVDGIDFTVQLFQKDGGPGPNGSIPYSIDGRIFVGDAPDIEPPPPPDDDGGANETPEPATLVLAALGVPFMGYVGLRRRKSAK